MNKQREMFEAWQLDSGRTDPMYLVYSEKDNRYALNNVQSDWDAWQAAVAAQEGDKLLWQSVSHPPEKHAEVMVWPYPSDYCMTAVYEGDRWHYAEYEPNWGLNHITCFPTHWMPLPLEPNK